MCVALMEVVRSGELVEVLWWAFLLRLWCIDQEIYGQQEVGVVGWSSEQRPENHAVSAESWYQNTLVREAITQGEVKKEESQGLGELPVFQGVWKRSRIKTEDIWEKEAEDHGAAETMDEHNS